VSDTETSYTIKIDEETTGLDVALGKLGQAEKASDKTAAAAGKLGKGMKHAGEASEKMGHAHRKHAEEAKGLEGALGRLVHSGLEPFLERAKQIGEFEFIRKGVDAVLEAPGEMIEKVRELGAEMIKASAHAERMDKSMQLLFGKEDAERQSGWVNQIRKVLPFTKQTIEDAQLELGRVGFKDTEKDPALSRAMAAAADMSSFSPNKEQGFAEALSALEKVRRTGDVEERTLGGLGLGKNDFLKELSKETGEGIETLKAKMSAGKMDVESSLNALYNVMLKKSGKAQLGDVALEMGKTLDARLTRLHDLPDVYMDKMADSKAHEKFSGFIDHLGKMLDPDTANGKKIFESMERSALSLVTALGKIDIGKDLMIAVEVLEKLPRLIDLSTKALEAFGFAAKAAAGPLLPVLGVTMLATPKERGELKSMASEAVYGKSSAELGKLGFLDRLTVGAKGAVKTVGGLFSSPFRDHSATEGLVKGIEEDTPKLHEAGAAAGKATVEGA
jgi:hypothetical protein